ncbi:Nucleoside triphosphate hydrolase domain-containing protein [Sulfitobacter noctilucae]|uniref:AAA family ATPase n=1 Tax=Sulfitobacter noctilucae TaxID=1342302 RepID=UPI000468CEC0|nr:AAA family ATPase [Sulfitobacter noctilucae]KIN70426.1 Nucleoside triphosphate hydrolase domain-containing protein [Sulfitobacter noctilucae]
MTVDRGASSADRNVPSLTSLVERITDLSANEARVLVAIAGPPASGKSTLADELASRLGPTAMVMPMDGFHMDNEALQELGLLDRKGAPETFDAPAFVDLVTHLREEVSLSFPTFDRAADKTVLGGGRVTTDTRIVLIEGNYLLLNISPWADLAKAFDLTISLQVDHDELERRLVARWVKHGLTTDAAKVRARGNDLKNARFVEEHSLPADMTVKGWSVA